MGEDILDRAKLELSPQRVCSWFIFFKRRGRKYPKDREIKWVEDNKDLLPIMFDIYWFFERYVALLVSNGYTVDKAVEVLIELVKERYVELKFPPKPMSGMLIDRMVKDRLKIYFEKVSALRNWYAK
ncbi:MAG: hypothetical protein ACTSWF_12060 [Candidatus Freyarchaeota archaeon]